MLARAFHDDPVSSWIMPDAQIRRRSSPRLFATNTRIVADKGEVWTTEEISDAALWAAPGR